MQTINSNNSFCRHKYDDISQLQVLYSDVCRHLVHSLNTFTQHRIFPFGDLFCGISMKFGIRFLDSISKFPGSNEFRVFFAYSVYICMYYWSFIEQYYWFKAVFCPYIWEFLAMQDAKDTRMHSSRMRTTRSLTMVCVFGWWGVSDLRGV